MSARSCGRVPGRWRRRLLLAAAALLLSLLVAEVVARLVIRHWDSLPPPKPPGGEQVMLVQMLQRSPHADVIYELQPHLDCRFHGVPVQTNAHGWRGPEHALEKPANGFRVLGLGDSVLFGWGVPWLEAGVARLEELLQRAVDGRPVDVIGTGVPGYNTAMEAALLRARGVAFRPDVVLIDFVDNDFDLPNFLLSPQDHARLDHCFLLDLARRVWHSNWLDPHAPFVWAPGDGHGRFESDPARVPAEYRHLVGFAAYRTAMQDVVALSQAHGFHVLVTSHYRLPEPVATLCDELGVPTVDVHARIDTFLQQGGEAAALHLSAGDPHPTALLHGWWAEAVVAKLRELRWLP